MRNRAQKKRQEIRERTRIKSLYPEIASAIPKYYLVEPCKRCRGTTMSLVTFGPEGRAIQYKCYACTTNYGHRPRYNRTRWADTNSHHHKEIYELWQEVMESAVYITQEIHFETHRPTLPYEVGSTKQIPQDVSA